VSEPYAINEAGAIAGWSGQANPKAPVHAVMWQGGKIVDLGVLAGRGRFPSGALAINAHGVAVGYTIGADRLRHPYEWRGRDGVALEVGAMNRRSFCTATAINDSGAVVGVCVRISRGRPLAPHAFVWQNGKATELTIRDRRYRAAAANWIDDDSHIFGVAEIPGGKSAIGAGGAVLVPGIPDAGANVARWRAVEWVVKR
jgi:probable HAF family extracellular repeat protein